MDQRHMKKRNPWVEIHVHIARKRDIKSMTAKIKERG
jgi:hypothetical protein